MLSPAPTPPARVNSDPALSIPEAAKYLRRSTKTVRRYIADKKLKAVQLATKQWAVRVSELEQFLRGEEVDPATVKKRPDNRHRKLGERSRFVREAA
jgi:excisionase family DNA binding protein